MIISKLSHEEHKKVGKTSMSVMILLNLYFPVSSFFTFTPIVTQRKFHVKNLTINLILIGEIVSSIIYDMEIQWEMWFWLRIQ